MNLLEFEQLEYVKTRTYNHNIIPIIFSQHHAIMIQTPRNQGYILQLVPYRSIRDTKNTITHLIIFILYLQNVLIPSSSLERNLKISNLCQDILSIHPKTRCSSFINRNGRVVESKFRDDGNNTGMTCQELEMLYMQCKLQSSMNTEFDGKLGHLCYTLICRESALEFIFPFYDGVIFVSLDKDISIQNVSKKILELIAKFESGSGVENLR